MRYRTPKRQKIERAARKVELDFLQEFGNNPTFIRFAAKVGAKLVEHKALVADLTTHAPAEAQAEITRLQNTPGYLNIGSAMTAAERQAITDKITELTIRAHPEFSTRIAG